MNIQKNTGTANTTYKANRPIKYIVIHYTAGVSSKKGSAYNTCAYFKSGNAGGSADFCVDDETIYQYNPDIKNRYCWAVGGSRYNVKYSSLSQSHYGKCTNTNCISIELCSNKTNKKSLKNSDTDWYLTDATLNNGIELTKYLMKTYNISADNVIMHHQVTGKLCPQPWCLNESKLAGWYNFKKRLLTNNETIDTTAKISINGRVNTYKAKNIGGYTYVVARPFLTALGYSVSWNNTKKRVVIDNTLVLDITTILEKGTSYISVRDTIDFLNKYDDWKYTIDKTVSYNPNTKTIIIS